jgi:RNA polymerase sigma factor (sigma-70 family)
MDPQQYDHLIPKDRGLDEDDRQDIYVALLDGKPASDADAAKIITAHINTSRTRKRRAHLRSSAVAVEEISVPRFSDNEDLWATFEHLPAKDADLLYRRYCNGKSMSEIATELGISQPTLRRRFSIIEKKLMVFAK